MMTISMRSSSVTILSLLLLLFLSGPGRAAPPQLMLATVWEKGDDPAGWWLSEKYDGVRGYWNGTQMLTRRGNPIAIPDSFRAQLPPLPLDGELWAGRGKFSTTLSIVRDQTPGPAWSTIRYLVFDAPAQSGPFETRLKAVSQWLLHHPSSQIQLIEQIRGTSKKELEVLMDQIEARGGEGVMLRAVKSPYQHGRSEHLR